MSREAEGTALRVVPDGDAAHARVALAGPCECGRPLVYLPGELTPVCPDCACPPGHCGCAQPQPDELPARLPGETWRPLDLAAALDGGCIEPPPALLAREDGHRLLYAAKVNSVAGESESLKTWLVLLACAAVLAGDGHVLFIDYEDAPGGITARLLALGCPPAAILSRFHYVRPDEPYTPAARAVLWGALPAPPSLAVVDGITEAMAAHGLDPVSNAEVAAFGARLPRPLAESGAAAVLIDHMARARDNGAVRRYALGAQHKRALVTGAAYTMDLVRPFGHGLHGVAKLTVAKDRPGLVRPHCPGDVAGFLHLDSGPDGAVTGRIAIPPPAAKAGSGEERPVGLMRALSEAIEETPGRPRRTVLGLVRGNTDAKRAALDLLIAEGFVATASGPRRALLHTSVRPFRGGDGQ